MPQTSDAVRKIIDDWFPFDPDNDMFSQDHLAHKLLLAKGWTERAGMFYPPTPSYYGPREDSILLKYLIEEWDYGCEMEPLIPDLK